MNTLVLVLCFLPLFSFLWTLGFREDPLPPTTTHTLLFPQYVSPCYANECRTSVFLIDFVSRQVIEGPGIYYFGIIDILQRMSCCLTGVHCVMEVSCVPELRPMMRHTRGHNLHVDAHKLVFTRSAAPHSPRLPHPSSPSTPHRPSPPPRHARHMVHHMDATRPSPPPDHHHHHHTARTTTTKFSAISIHSTLTPHLLWPPHMPPRIHRHHRHLRPHARPQRW